MKGITRRLAAAGLGVAATIGLMSVPAGVASASPAQHLGVGVTGANGLSESSTFAGFGVSLFPMAKSVAGTFTVPAVTCPETSEVNIADSIFDTKGKLQAASALIIDCSGGVPSYVITTLTFTTSGPTVTVQPGDVLSIVDSETPTTTSATVTDMTAGTSSTTEDPTGSSGNIAQTVFIGLFDDTSGAPVIPTFGTLAFTNLLANGVHMSAVAPLRFEETDGSRVMVATSKMKSSQFTLTFKHNT
jgi:hypothetical protein